MMPAYPYYYATLQRLQASGFKDGLIDPGCGCDTIFRLKAAQQLFATTIIVY
jgi:hypothetical protein